MGSPQREWSDVDPNRFRELRQQVSYLSGVTGPGSVTQSFTLPVWRYQGVDPNKIPGTAGAEESGRAPTVAWYDVTADSQCVSGDVASAALSPALPTTATTHTLPSQVDYLI